MIFCSIEYISFFILILLAVIVTRPNTAKKLILLGLRLDSSYQRQLSAIMTWPGMVDRIRRISLPTLVVHGAADPLVPYGNGLYLSTMIRGAKLLTYTNVGHLLPIEASARFNQDVMEFLG